MTDYDAVMQELIRLVRLVSGAVEQLTSDDDLRSEISEQLTQLNAALAQAEHEHKDII